jgi:hypothetical protein
VNGRRSWFTAANKEAVSFLLGIGGIIYEAVSQHEPRTGLLVVYVTLVGAAPLSLLEKWLRGR